MISLMLIFKIHIGKERLQILTPDVSEILKHNREEYCQQSD